MNKDWHPDDLARHWLLSPDEHDLLGESGATRLNFAILLKTFQLHGRFPERRDDITASVVSFVAKQVGVPPEVYFESEWSERTQRLQRARVRGHCGFQTFRAEHEEALIGWLSQRVGSPNPDAEDLKTFAYAQLRSQRLEPPEPVRLRRLLGAAVDRRIQQLNSQTAARLSPATREALDTLVKTTGPENDEDRDPLVPVRSELAAVKDGAGAVKVDTVLKEIEKLKKLRALNLPEDLFREAPSKLVMHYRRPRRDRTPPRVAAAPTRNPIHAAGRAVLATSARDHRHPSRTADSHRAPGRRSSREEGGKRVVEVRQEGRGQDETALHDR